MYSETQNNDQVFHELKQSDTYGIEIAAEEMQHTEGTMCVDVVKRFIKANARKDAIKQINVALSIINDTSKERQRLNRIKEVYETLDDADFIKYVYEESDPKKVEMYIASIYNDMHSDVSSRQYALMYLSAIDTLYGERDRDHADRLDKAIELISSMSDRVYINLTMDLMNSSCSTMSTLGKLIGEHGVDMIKKAKEKR